MFFVLLIIEGRRQVQPGHKAEMIPLNWDVSALSS